MKKNIFFLILITTVFVSQTPILAQNAATERKMNNLISTLDDTPFIRDYKNYKSEVEGLVTEIKLAKSDTASATKINATEMAKVKLAYNQSKLRFDALLDQLKRDLANNATRKLITQSPEVFSDKYQKRLDESKVYCNDHFKRKATTLLGTDALDDKSIELLIGTFFTVFKSLKDDKTAKDEFSVLFLETNLVAPLRFKAWDKIE